MRWTWPGREVALPPYAAARGILLAVMLSSVLWIGLAISLWACI